MVGELGSLTNSKTRPGYLRQSMPVIQIMINVWELLRMEGKEARNKVGKKVQLLSLLEMVMKTTQRGQGV